MDPITGEPTTTISIVTDGNWLWYSDLPHYLETHGSALPDEFVRHVLSTGPYTVSDQELDRVVAQLKPPAPDGLDSQVPGLLEPVSPWPLILDDVQ